MAVIGARPAIGIGVLPRRPRARVRAADRPRRRSGAGRRRREIASISSVLVAIAAAAGLGLFYLSQSSHVAATGYEIEALQAQLAELRSDQLQLVFEIGEARSPAVVEERAKRRLHLKTLPSQAVTFAPAVPPSSIEPTN
jgi:cell division protein FtsB